MVDTYLSGYLFIGKSRLRKKGEETFHRVDDPTTKTVGQNERG